MSESSRETLFSISRLAYCQKRVLHFPQLIAAVRLPRLRLRLRLRLPPRLSPRPLSLPH